MAITIPSCLDWLCSSVEGRAWIESLPDVVVTCADRWNLDPGQPVDNSYVSLVLPAVTMDGEPAMLKIQFPDRESQHEAAALEAWNGLGAIRLLDRQPENHALLLERCTPGSRLSIEPPDVALGVMIDLLPKLWLPVKDGFNSLSDEVDRWVHNLPVEWERSGRPFPRTLLDAGIEALTDLAASQGEQVLLHQDLHADNVLRARREPWLAIDPKPLVGEREFGLSPIIRAYELGHSERDTIHRLDRLTNELGLDRDRSRRWAFGHALAWGFEGDKVLPEHIETARWLLAAG